MGWLNRTIRYLYVRPAELSHPPTFSRYWFKFWSYRGQSRRFDPCKNGDNRCTNHSRATTTGKKLSHLIFVALTAFSILFHQRFLVNNFGFDKTKNDIVINKTENDIVFNEKKNDIGEDESELMVAYITYSYLGNFTHFDRTILASVKTWLPPKEKYYVVLNHKWEETFEQYKKEKTEMDAAMSTYVNRIEPIFVDCPEHVFGESPCCKQQEGLIEFYNKYFYYQGSNEGNESNRKIRSQHYDWVVYMDDDMHFQNDLFTSLARALPYAIQDQFKYLKNPTNPMLFTSDGRNPKPLGKSGYDEWRSFYTCSKDSEYRYPWGQPVIYNKASLEQILPGLKAKGLVKQCLEFNVTHDVGNAIFHWMYSIPSATVRVSNLLEGRRFFFRDDMIAYHKAGKTLPMEVIHRKRNRMAKNIFQNIKLPSREYFGWWNVTGFHQTETYRNFGNPSQWGEEWHTMPVQDCRGPLSQKRGFSL